MSIKLKFLMPPEFAEYDLSMPPSQRNRGGGVGVKYARIAEIEGDYDCERISEVDEIESDDVVFVDWLWFCTGQSKSLVDQAKLFIELPNPKIIYGSELTVLGYPQAVVQRLIENANLITFNTEYQRKLYRVIGIYDARFLCDPVPESLFKPAHSKELQVVCMGQISASKRTDAVLEIFKRLEGSEIKRVYIGGSLSWGNNNQDKELGTLHSEITAHSDIFIENATQAEVASTTNKSAFYVHTAYHDVASSSCQENMMSGNVVLGLVHPMLRERTPYRFADVDLLVDAIIEYPFESEQHEQDVEKARAIAEAWSYKAWIKQLASILKLVV